MQKNLPSVFFFNHYYHYYYYLNQNTFETSLTVRSLNSRFKFGSRESHGTVATPLPPWRALLAIKTSGTCRGGSGRGSAGNFPPQVGRGAGGGVGRGRSGSFSSFPRCRRGGLSGFPRAAAAPARLRSPPSTSCASASGAGCRTRRAPRSS